MVVIKDKTLHWRKYNHSKLLYQNIHIINKTSKEVLILHFYSILQRKIEIFSTEYK